MPHKLGDPFPLISPPYGGRGGGLVEVREALTKSLYPKRTASRRYAFAPTPPLPPRLLEALLGALGPAQERLHAGVVYPARVKGAFGTPYLVWISPESAWLISFPPPDTPEQRVIGVQQYLDDGEIRTERVVSDAGFSLLRVALSRWRADCSHPGRFRGKALIPVTPE